MILSAEQIILLNQLVSQVRAESGFGEVTIVIEKGEPRWVRKSSTSAIIRTEMCREYIQVSGIVSS